MLDSKGFDRWAGNYDESIANRLDSFPFEGYYDLLSSIVALSEPGAGLRVIDVGVGTALLSEELDRQGCEVYGVDFSNQMLAEARLRIPDGRFDLVDVSEAHLGAFNNERFDRIVSSYFFHHLSSPQKIEFIKRSFRDNLSPSGKIIIGDVGFENEKEFELARIRAGRLWDENEYYIVGDGIVLSLAAEGITAQYKQVSSCAGILVCEG